MAKKYPIGIQDFESLRNGGFYYVDKTDLAYKLATEGKYYFLSRPRRFGKSLLTSTLKAYFLGKRELFDGLAIANLETDWVEYPVFNVDLSSENYTSTEILEEVLNRNVDRFAAAYGLSVTGMTPSQRFKDALEEVFAKTGKQTVMLIDEYDKPLIDNILNTELRERMRDVLSGFYGNLKSMDAYLRFGFLTGVSRFSHLNIFSAVNNLNDISFSEKYAGLCGITEEEVDGQFHDDVQEIADKNNLTFDTARQKLREWYDGYRFCPFSDVGVYNPFSLLNTFSSGRFLSKWAESGTPTFLVRLVREGIIDLPRVADTLATQRMLAESDPTVQHLSAMLFQTGYLTIKHFDEETGLLHLGFPNREVRDSFLNFLLPVYNYDAPVEVLLLRSELLRGDVEAFMTRLTAFFSSISYETIKRDYERHYQNLLYTVFYFAGCDVRNEFHIASGRIDCVVKTKTTIYVFEYKLDGNGTAADALEQINEKGYARPFLADGRPVVKIGVVFGKDSHTIDEWVKE